MADEKDSLLREGVNFGRVTPGKMKNWIRVKNLRVIRREETRALREQKV